MLKTMATAVVVLGGLSWFDSATALAGAVIVTVEVDPSTTRAKVGDKVLVTVGDGDKAMPTVTAELKMITIRGRTFLGVQVTVSDPKHVVDPAKDKARAALLTGDGAGRKGAGAVSASSPYQSNVSIR